MGKISPVVTDNWPREVHRALPEPKLYKLLGPDGSLYLSDQRGLFGGHRGGRAVCLPDRYALWKIACAQADVPRLVRSRVRRQAALDIYRDLLTLAGMRYDDEEITRRLDEVYAQESATIDPVIARLAARSLPEESG